MRSFSGAQAAYQVEAPAKINLTLHVVGRRDDGFHLLESLVAFAGACDLVSAAPAKDLSLSVEGPFADALGCDPDNLVLRAARALREHTGTTVGAALTLRKALPVAAGIGGGSSDAAAALRTLRLLWDVAPDHDAMMRIAAGLGADVPVCFDGAPAFMAGIGEKLSRVDGLPQAPIVLVNPLRPVPTGPVFKGLDGHFTAPRHPAMDFTLRHANGRVGTSDLVRALRAWGNDLSAPAVRIEPAVKRVLEALEETPDCQLARMSGSGGTCFGVFEEEDAARRAAAMVQEKRQDWWVRATALRREPPVVERIPL